jgi:hypothetical protein
LSGFPYVNAWPACSVRIEAAGIGHGGQRGRDKQSRGDIRQCIIEWVGQGSPVEDDRPGTAVDALVSIIFMTAHGISS